MRIPKRLSETGLVNQILQYLMICPEIDAWRCNTGGMKRTYTKKNGVTKGRYVKFNFAGMSDIIGMCENGRFLAIEVKVGDNEQSDPQKDFQRRVERRGGLYILAYCLDDVIKGLGKSDD